MSRRLPVRARFEEGALLVSSWGREKRAVRFDEPFDDASRVLAAIQKLFDAIRDRNETRVRSVLDPDSRVRGRGGLPAARVLHSSSLDVNLPRPDRAQLRSA